MPFADGAKGFVHACRYFSLCYRRKSVIFAVVPDVDDLRNGSSSAATEYFFERAFIVRVKNFLDADLPFLHFHTPVAGEHKHRIPGNTIKYGVAHCRRDESI